MNQNVDHQRVAESPGGSTNGPRKSRPWVRLIPLLAAAALMMALTSGCGDDEETSTEETSTEETSTDETSTDDTSSDDAFCAAGDSLESNVQGLGDIDIVSDGTSALDAQFEAISSDLEDLRGSGSDVATDEIAALEAAVDQLEADLDALGDEVTAEGASAVGDSVNSVVTGAQTVADTLEATCP